MKIKALYLASELRTAPISGAGLLGASERANAQADLAWDGPEK
jgi:hypothetical protein